MCMLIPIIALRLNALIKYRPSEDLRYIDLKGVDINCKELIVPISPSLGRLIMTMHNDFSTQASTLMLELNDATTVMMGMVGAHRTTGPLWLAATARQSLSFGRWNAFINRSDVFGPALS